MDLNELLADNSSQNYGHWRADDYRAAAFTAATLLRQGPVVTAPCPGNSTSYTMVLTPVGHLLPVDAWASTALAANDKAIVVALPHFRGRPCWMFTPGYTDPTYVTEKLGVSDTDAVVIATFLNALWEQLG